MPFIIANFWRLFLKNFAENNYFLLLCYKILQLMRLDDFLNLINMDSTSGKERRLAEFLAYGFATARCEVELFEVGDGSLNLYFSWGKPRVVFCTHLDTVPPFIPARTERIPAQEQEASEDIRIYGRGSCDAKGQIYAMYTACVELEEMGCTDFGLLLVSGEETGSHGAKMVRNQVAPTPYLVVGEPTDNRMVTACKGTKSFEVILQGQSAHSGYPEHGISAILRFNEWINRLQTIDFPTDPILGATTWNIGQLHSDNAQNMLSDQVRFRIYFRTTFVSDQQVCQVMDELRNEYTHIIAHGGDTPAHYYTLEGFPTTTVAFGNDAPHLPGYTHKIICGPGSILVAHTEDESIRWSEIRQAADLYKTIYHQIQRKTE